MANGNNSAEQVRLFPPSYVDSRVLEQVSETALPAFTSASFPYSLVLKVTSSEPRDVLQSERTCLAFIRFACALFFTALGIIFNFKLDLSGKTSKTPKNRFLESTYSTVVSFILIGLALFTLAISGVNYFVTVRRYANHKIKTYSFNNLTTVVCMTSVVLTLAGISVSLIVEGYRQEA